MHLCIVIWLQAFEGQGVECGSLKEMSPKGSNTIKSCGLVGVGMILLEEMCHCGGGL